MGGSHSILECCVAFSGVKLSMRSFVLFIIIIYFFHSSDQFFLYFEFFLSNT